VTGVGKEYQIEGREGAVVALSGVDVNSDTGSTVGAIKRGEFVMIRGPSGGGKTSLLNILGTIDVATSGTVQLFGCDIGLDTSDEALTRLRLEKIGFVFQTFNLLATMSAYENVELPMNLLNRLTSAERHARVIDLLGRVGLTDRMDHLPSELSGGEQQRVTIARSLANRPELILLDEPTGDLDTRNTVSEPPIRAAAAPQPQLPGPALNPNLPSWCSPFTSHFPPFTSHCQVDIMDLLLQINREEEATLVMVTHNPDVECYADRIFYVEDGRIVEQAVNEQQTPLVFEDYVAWLEGNH